MLRPITRSSAYTVITCLLLTTETRTYGRCGPILLVVPTTAFTVRPSLSRPTLNNNGTRKCKVKANILSRALLEDGDENNAKKEERQEDQPALLDRRRALQRSSSAAVLLLLSSSLIGWSASSSVSHAYYDKAYPAELTMTDTNSEVDARDRKINAIRRQEAERVARNNAAFTPTPSVS